MCFKQSALESTTGIIIYNLLKGGANGVSEILRMKSYQLLGLSTFDSATVADVIGL